MERIVIIDHENHALYFEDVTDEMLAPFKGEEEAYIKFNYHIPNNNFSWDYVTEITYYTKDGDPCDIEILDYDTH